MLKAERIVTECKFMIRLIDMRTDLSTMSDRDRERRSQADQEEYFNLNIIMRALTHAVEYAEDREELASTVQMQVPLLDEMCQERLEGHMRMHEKTRKRMEEDL